MSKIIIGAAGGRNVGFAIDELLVSRLLVQANSGGGKSFLLRRILEQAYGKVQAVVIDPAGEFATLREKYGYVLVGEHGETPADVRSAGLVAEKLLELRASAVCDLYSLKPGVRHTWVNLFLTAVMNAPKRLWHPVLFVVDEAHKFAPEKGEGESEAREMMLSLSSDGRKYGFCGIFATQRLAKLDKSLASELLNVLIGPTFMDIDLQRAHKALGIVPKDQAAFNQQMKTIRPGHFWALGRAISKTRLLVTIGGVETTHPQAGSGKYSAEPPPAPEKVRAMLPKLADLPKEAEQKARSEAEFKREIRELKSKLSLAEKAKPATVQTVKADPGQARTILHLRSALEDVMRVLAKVTMKGFEGDAIKTEEIEAALKKAAVEIGRLAAAKLTANQREFDVLKKDLDRVMRKAKALLEGDNTVTVGVNVTKNEPVTVSTKPPVRARHAPESIRREGGSANGAMGPGERAILIAVAQFGTVERDQLTVLTGYKRSSRDTYIQRLSQRGYVAVSANGLAVTQEGIDALGSDYEPLPTGEDLQRYWLGRLTGGERAIFEFLLGHDGPIDRDVISEGTGYKRSSRDTYLQRLSSRCLVENFGRAQVQLTEQVRTNGAAA
ncbi:MAG TPA: DUF87 domain-containing protein [Candidatus Acidoferrum sp.]|nr:DUF87 domain-containing protein [Candidatus Acidoferrum sp.]